MKNKGFFKTAAALLAALVLLGGFSVTAYAGGGEDIPTNDSGVIVETEPQPLTPDGNLSLIDDIEGEAAEDKQFIIVQSKNGNYFYIIVDRAAEGENTVHFLNQVDEADLMALMEDGSSKAQPPAVCTCKDKCKAGAVNTACPVCSVNMTECAGKEAKGDAAAQPHIKVVRYPVLCEYQCSPIKQHPGNQNGQNRFLKKVFPYLTSRHNLTSVS